MIGYAPIPTDFQSVASTKLASLPYVEMMGLEPITFRVSGGCSHHWATFQFVVVFNFNSGKRRYQLQNSGECGHVGNRTHSLWLQIRWSAIDIRPIKQKTPRFCLRVFIYKQSFCLNMCIAETYGHSTLIRPFWADNKWHCMFLLSHRICF